jgi:hypothetical protein
MATAPISDTDTRAEYTATASQTTFAYTWWIKEESDLDVYVDGTLKTLTTDYTISAVQSVSGANVVFNSGLSGGESVIIETTPDIERATEFSTSGSFKAADLNLELTYLVFLLQYLRTELDRTAKLSASVTGVTSVVLPAPADGQFVAWDGTGGSMKNISVSSIGSAVLPSSITDNALIKADGTSGNVYQSTGITIDDSNNISGVGTVDGRDVAADGSKLDGIEAGADVTDSTNVLASLSGQALAVATVDTGQGANELYAMDQDVQTTDDVTFASVNTGNGAVELYPSGTYTPTLTETSGITSSSVGTCYYYRVGNMVHVFGSVTIEPSGVSADTILDVSLPIASDLTAGGQLSGAFRVANAGDQPVGVIFGNTGDVARFRITAGNVASREFSFLFSYVVL